MVNFFNKK